MERKPNLRFEFVEMLFALAIGQVGIEIGDLVVHSIKFNDYPNLYSHILLGTLIITLSWIGWQSSSARGNSEIVLSIFSFQFIILLLDISLVICYFIIVKTAEVPFNSNNSTEVNKKLNDISTSTSNEAIWTIVIFSIYLVWDFFTKCWVQNFVAAGGSWKKVRKFEIQDFKKRGWQTFICLTTAILIYLFMTNPTTRFQSCIVDCVLISLFIQFRGFKQNVTLNYQLTKDQIASTVLSSQLTGVTFPINLSQKRSSFLGRKFLVKWLPSLMILVGVLMYAVCNGYFTP